MADVLPFRKTSQAKANVQAIATNFSAEARAQQEAADQAYELKQFHEDELSRLKACLERLYSVSPDVRRTKALAERAVSDQSRKYGL